MLFPAHARIRRLSPDLMCDLTYRLNIYRQVVSRERTEMTIW